MNWDCNPKQRFNRNHLEKCYNLRDTSTTYRGLGVGHKETIVGRKDDCKNNRPVEEKSPKRGKPMGYKKRPREDPYWNFWRAVFAGWLIRYPMQIFKGIGTIVIGLFLFGVLVLSESSEYNTNTPNVPGEVRE